MVFIQVPVSKVDEFGVLFDGWLVSWLRLDGLHGQRTVGHGQLRGDLLPV